MPTTLSRAAIYDEIGELSDFMPENFHRLFCFRWGLKGRSPHTLKQTARRFQLTTGSADSRLQRCLWNIARHARHHHLPALHATLGDDPDRWARRAWEQADRWGNQESQFAEAVMLVALAGVDVTEARGAVREHMIQLRLARTNQWTPPHSPEQRVAAARGPVTQILDHILWPRTLVLPQNLDQFENLRPLGRFASAKTGVFQSAKQRELIEYSSDLERMILRHLDADPRVHSLCEQPLRIPYVLDGQAHDYYPDAIVRLQDGRVFVMEIKPPENLGEFDGWLKWATLARYCATRGYGLYVGSPNRSIIDHYRITPGPEQREFINSVIREGVTGQEYKALLSLVGPEELGFTATADNLDWRTNRSRIRHAQGVDHDETRRFWRLVGICADKRRADHSSRANPASGGGNN